MSQIRNIVKTDTVEKYRSGALYEGSLILILSNGKNIIIEVIIIYNTGSSHHGDRKSDRYFQTKSRLIVR
jgi:hypothetical protein